jgi:DNA-binding protein HU-beta
MPEVGDRVSLTSKGVPRLGVVTAVQATMLRVRWDSGDETSLFPGPGTLRVVRKARKRPSSPAAAPTRAASPKPAAKATATRAAPAKAAATKTVKKSAPAKAAARATSATKKTAVPSAKRAGSKKAAPARTSGRKTR